jgi:hypothetical protein
MQFCCGLFCRVQMWAPKSPATTKWLEAGLEIESSNFAIESSAGFSVALSNQASPQQIYGINI